MEEVANLTLAIGREVASRGRWDWVYDRPRDKTILLIHGYNTTEKKCVKSLGRFRDNLGALHEPIKQDVFTSSWPGTPIIGRFGYSLMIPKAKSSARALLGTIQTWYASRGTPELVIIAHSLGCRVTLELLLLMREAGRPAGLRRLTIVLMAAAVPVPFLKTGGSLENAVGVADDIFVLYSKQDWALSDLAFGLGQWAAGEGWLPAVGKAGEPRTVWTDGRRRDMEPLDHGDYWKSDTTAHVVANLLGIPISGLSQTRPLQMRPQLPMARDLLQPELPRIQAKVSRAPWYGRIVG